MVLSLFEDLLMEKSKSKILLAFAFMKLRVHTDFEKPFSNPLQRTTAAI
jgi:hypothetical protein